MNTAAPLLLLVALAAGAAEPRPVLTPFAYADVRLTGGPLDVQAREARDFYLALDEDSLLQGFRLRAGRPAPGKPMGGWYDPEDFAGAHPFGQFVSALARMYAQTGDARFRDKVARLVRGFHETMGPDGFFYSSAKAARDWPCYIYDKNAAGMRDAYLLTGNAEALLVLRKMTDWAEKNMPRRSDEWYTLSEGFYKSWRLTKEKRYLTLAAEYDYSKEFFDPFAAGKNAFTPERHAYSHVNSLASAAAAYEVLGDEKYLAAIRSAWRLLNETQDYASGGWGPDEHFVTPGQGKLAESLTKTGQGFETPCGTYATVNLDRYLLRFTGAARYGDDMERVLLNGLLAALPPLADGHAFYYSDYRPGAQKGRFQYQWPCCAGTYAEATADYPLNVYFHDDGGVYVNLFVPSRLTWKRKDGDVVIEQLTDFPANGKTTLVVRTKKPVRFSLHVRVPGWSQRTEDAALNGAPLAVDAATGTFASVERDWHDGDRLDVAFAMPLRFAPIDAQTPDRAALMRGPVLLAALSDKDVDLRGDPARPGDWIKPDGTGAADWRTDGGVTFRPFYLIRDERYTTYPRLVGR